MAVLAVWHFHFLAFCMFFRFYVWHSGNLTFWHFTLFFLIKCFFNQIISLSL